MASLLRNMDRNLVRHYVQNAEIALAAVAIIKVRDPRISLAITAVAALVRATKTALDASEPPALTVINGGKTNAD
jgi:hypothetical protein